MPFLQNFVVWPDAGLRVGWPGPPGQPLAIHSEIGLEQDSGPLLQPASKLPMLLKDSQVCNLGLQCQPGPACNLASLLPKTTQ